MFDSKEKIKVKFFLIYKSSNLKTKKVKSQVSKHFHSSPFKNVQKFGKWMWNIDSKIHSARDKRKI